MGIEEFWEDEPREVRVREQGEALDGFSVDLGVIKSKKDKDLRVLLRRDVECWVLQIGSRMTFYSKLSAVFGSIAQYEHILQTEKSVEDIIAEMTRIEDHIVELGAILDEKIKDFLRSRFPDGPPPKRKKEEN